MAGSESTFSHLVVVGASAGGVESLSVLVSTLSPTFPAPIVVAQHMSPNRHSALAEILARRGPLPVRTIGDVEPLKPGVVYVVPPNRNVMITDHEVQLVNDGSSPQPSIDMLFKSAAELFGENCVAVVLSGTGSDGAMGAREVKYAGGTVIIQNPDTAAYPGMPLSLAPSIVDIVANRERIGELLNNLLSGGFDVPPVSEHSQLRAFLDDIREQSGIDFSSYKQPTIERRLQRRMIATGNETMTDYIQHVQEQPEERQRLITSFLIKVTEFFRDPELYTYLGDEVMPDLIRQARDRGGDLRIWSAGCATGEEAYSLAMTVADAIGDSHGNLNVKIFATDLDETAVTFARRGIYPARSLSGVSPEQLARYFSPFGDDFEVKKTLRRMLVFGEHDLGQRAPFPRIDMILCRNVLIYFTLALQRRALQLFAFSLRTGGCLVLGKSESVSPLAEFFTVDNSRLKVFRRIGDRVLLPPSRIRDAAPISLSSIRTASPFAAIRTQRPVAETHTRAASWQSDHVLLGLTVGVVTIDRNYDIRYINGEARRLFGIHSSALEQDFIHLIKHYDPAPVRRAIDDSLASETLATVVVQPLASHPDAQRVLEIGCSQIARTGEDDEVVVVLTAVDVTDREQLRQRQAGAEEINSRLTKANDEVLAANQDLSYTISRLRSENEELMVVTEEIQAATEEVETLNEELQASNEELETVNEELHATVEELNTTNDDLESRTLEVKTLEIEGDTARRQRRTILDGVEDGIVVVDANGSIILENAAYTAIAAEFDAEDATLVDEAGEAIAKNSMPIRRAAQGNHFAMTIVYQRSGTQRRFQVRGNPVTTDRGGALGVVTFREVPASG
jgi:two-component system CheB/CheR fusion protein